MKVLITGGTGLIGKRLSTRLVERGDEVTVVTRRPDRTAPQGVQYVGSDSLEIAHDAVVTLAGEPLFGKRWSARQKEVIRTSRVEGTREVAEKIAAASPRPTVFVSGSAIGYYGEGGDTELTEDSPAGAGFLPGVVQEWEAAAAPAEAAGVRTVVLRIGVVLAKDGGALPSMMFPFKLFVGGPAGSGRQWMSWIHLDDLVGLIMFAIDTESLRGPVNGTAPQPERMKQFCKKLGRAMKRPSWAPVPGFVLRVMMGEVASVITSSSRVLPRRAEAAGFEFAYPEAEAALRAVLGSAPVPA